ncbi:MAG: segregation/condensation protein A, partial [Oscillospiraceae bacterium]
MEQLKFKLTGFEGPLDLLLTLIRKNKMSIYDIPIAVILDQYIAVMTDMKELDLEVSSEFLVLAATLLQIKSKMLLPKPEVEDDGLDPREELVKRLIEYKKAKMGAKYLTSRQHIGGERFYKLPDPIERPPAEWNYSSLTPENLVIAYKRAFQKLERSQPPPRRSFEGIVGHEKVSVKSRVKRIWDNFKKKSNVLFKELFIGTKTRPEAVASFLAVLELIKLKKIVVE